MDPNNKPENEGTNIGSKVSFLKTYNQHITTKDHSNQTSNQESKNYVIPIGGQTTSYVGKAFISFLLYYLGLFIGGLVANIIFLSEAKREEDLIKKTPPGKGCLVFLLWTHLLIPLILIFISFVLGINIIESIFN